MLTTLSSSIFQVQQASTGPPKYSGPVDVVKTLYREGGIKSIYKGTLATLLRGKIMNDKE
jgi:solute carrier family 25 carnitine/acylcarnitine transporter 20/29